MSYGKPKNLSEGFGTPLVRAEKISITPPQKGQFWGAEILVKIEFLGLKIRFLQEFLHPKIDLFGAG